MGKVLKIVEFFLGSFTAGADLSVRRMQVAGGLFLSSQFYRQVVQLLSAPFMRMF